VSRAGWRLEASKLILACALGVALVPSWCRAQLPPNYLSNGSDSSLFNRPEQPTTSWSATRGTPRPTLTGPIDPKTYVLGPGDVLSLDLGGRAIGSQVLVVDAEGRVRFPDLGAVAMAGRTLDDARDDVIRGLKRFYPGATIQLRLVQPRTFKVYVLGEVSQPGLVEVVGSARVMEALDASGGLATNASTRNIQVIRRNGPTLTADVERFRRTGDWEGNPVLQDGDRIVVPSVIQRIGIFGGVSHPGWIEYHSGDSLFTALRVVGGTLPEARLDSVRVIRYRGATSLDTIRVNLSKGFDPALDLALQPDDRVFVPEQFPWRPSRQVNISGEVVRPGVYAIVEGRDRVSDLLGWAGGFTEFAARRNVHLIRRPESTTDEKDIEFERLNRLSRSEMTDAEYQTFRSKLALRQASYLIDFSTGAPTPPDANILLRDNDQLEVPRQELAVRVDGSVKRPGFVDFKSGMDYWDYVKMAGGETSRADVNKTRLTKVGTGNTLLARDGGRIEAGDFLYVPEKKDISTWSVAKDLLLVAGQVATIILLIDTVGHH